MNGKYIRWFGAGLTLACILWALPVNAGLVSYYQFNGSANDYFGNNDGTLMGPAATVAAPSQSPVGGHTSLDLGAHNNGAYVQVGGSGWSGDAVANNALTISLWQYAGAAQPAADFSFFAVSPGTSGGNRGASAHLPWSDGRVYWDTAGCCGGNVRLNTAPNAAGPFDQAWHHYVLLKDGSRKEIWRDGVLITSHNIATAALQSFTSLAIGSNATGGQSYAGYIDEFSVWDRALTPAEIQSLAAGASAALVAGLPEPATTALVLTGLAALMGGRRRAKRI